MAKRAANGSGGISLVEKTVKRSGKTYSYRYWVYRWSLCGKQYTSPHFQTQAEAVQFQRQIMSESLNGSLVAPSRMRFDELCDLWLSDCRQNVVASTRANSELCVRLFLKPAFGHMRPSAISFAMWQHFINNLHGRTVPGAKKPTSASRIKLLCETMNMIMDFAKRQGIVGANNLRGVDKPAVKIVKGTSFTEDELKLFLNEIAGSKYETLLHFYLYTGTRLAEALGVEWRSFHYDKDGGSYVRIEQQLYRNKSLVPTKTKDSRDVYIGADFADTLRALKKKQLAEGIRSKYIFCKPDGEPLAHSTVKQYYAYHLEKLGIKHRLHDLRHTYGTLLYHEGIGIKELQTQLGHKNIRTTMDTYVDPSNEAKQTGAHGLESTLSSLMLNNKK